MRTTYVTLLGVLAAAAAATPAGDDGNVSSFHCWTEADGAIRCQWSKTYAEARVVYSKTFDRDTEPLDDCRPDDQLTTATQVGCTTKYANAFIRYTLRLVDADNHKIWQIDNFVGQNYLKITDPLIDFDAQRYENGTVHLTWNYNPSQKFLNSLHGEKIVLLLLYRPFMQSGAYSERILGYQKDLQSQIYLNDLPNSHVLELCIRVRKLDSLVKAWSPCSNKAILRPVNLPTIETPPDQSLINVTCTFSFCQSGEFTGQQAPPPKQNKLKNKIVFVATCVVLFATVFIFSIVIKRNWRRIKYYILPPIPYPNLHFLEPDAAALEESSAGLIERHDIIDTTMADTTLDMTNRTEITFINRSADPADNNVTDNNERADSESIAGESSNTSQRSLDSGFGAPEPSTDEHDAQQHSLNCPPSRTTPPSPPSIL